MTGESFSALTKELKSACDQRDWEGLKSLDLRVRRTIEQAVLDASSETERQHLAMYLRRVQKIYQLLIKDSEKHRNQIATELQKLTRDQKAVNSYLDSSRL